MAVHVALRVRPHAETVNIPWFDAVGSKSSRIDKARRLVDSSGNELAPAHLYELLTSR